MINATSLVHYICGVFDVPIGLEIPAARPPGATRPGVRAGKWGMQDMRPGPIERRPEVTVGAGHGNPGTTMRGTAEMGEMNV
jgi:hypothetical protein